MLAASEPSLIEAVAAKAAAVVVLAPTVDLESQLRAALPPEIQLLLLDRTQSAPGAPFTDVVFDSEWPAAAGNQHVCRVIDFGLAQLENGGNFYLIGDKRHGGPTFARYLESVAGPAPTIALAKGHRLVVATPETAPIARREQPTSVIDVDIWGEALRMAVAPGAFAGGALDPATRLLLEHLEIQPNDQVLDLGCGAGYLGLAAARAAPQGSATLVDNNPEAVRLARLNAQLNGIGNVEVSLSSGYEALAGRRFDLIVTNPPFHRGHETTSAVASAFIQGAPAHLKRGGRFLLVANSFLPYEKLLSERFGRCQTVVDSGRYKVLQATTLSPD